MKYHLTQIKDIMRDYLRYSDEIIKFNLHSLNDEDENNLENQDLLEDLVYRRDNCIDYMSENITQEMFQDTEFKTMFDDCISLNGKVEAKLKEMISYTSNLIEENFKDMSNQGRDKIAIRNYLKSQELDGVSNFYLDKKK